MPYILKQLLISQHLQIKLFKKKTLPLVPSGRKQWSLFYKGELCNQVSIGQFNQPMRTSTSHSKNINHQLLSFKTKTKVGWNIGKPESRHYGFKLFVCIIREKSAVQSIFIMVCDSLLYSCTTLFHIFETL